MRIFLSYRREDASAWAGRLRDSLSARFGEGNIFQDVVAVRPGQDFMDAVDSAISRADAVLVVIGPRWLAAAGDHGEPRLTDQDDYVRAELVAALSRAGTVIPVLVGGATMPAAASLPPDLQPLALLQAVTLRDESWRGDVEGLVDALRSGDHGLRRWRWPIVAATVGAALVAAAIVLVVVSRDSGPASSATTAPPPATAGGATTTFDPQSVIAQCATPSSSSGWTPLGLTGRTKVGRVADAKVVEGFSKKAGDGRWDIVLSATYTNLVASGQHQYWWFYDLSLGGRAVKATCFSVTGGQDPANQGETSEVLVGFGVSADPAKGGALLIDNVGQRGRIDLSPT
jgi:hypothetical protein